MKILVDRKICAGHALCAAKAPELYKLDDEGFCISDGLIVPPGLAGRAEDGAACCPEQAITLVDED